MNNTSRKRKVKIEQNKITNRRRCRELDEREREETEGRKGAAERKRKGAWWVELMGRQGQGKGDEEGKGW